MVKASADDAIVITAAGLASPFGGGLAQALTGLREGRVCLEAGVVVPNLSERPLVAAAVPGASGDARALLANALADAQVTGAVDGVFIGSCSGVMRDFEAWMQGRRGDADGRWYEALGDALPKAPVHGVYSSACTSSLTALDAAVRAVRARLVERALVVGVDAICAFSASGFAALRALSAAACRPFSRHRDGLSIGEGAAVCVIERAAAATRPPLARVLGSGLSCDARHMTAPRADGLGLERAIRQALRAARLAPRDIDVYVSHGTATVVNDAMERSVGERMGFIEKPWLAHKAFIGHAMGASGLMSLCLAVGQVRAEMHAHVPYDDLEAGVRLDAPLAGCEIGLSVSSAFGGSNAAAVWQIA